MFRKTFSQKAARVFEVIGYLLLVPATSYLIISLILVLGVLISFQRENLFFQILYLIGTLIPFFIYSLGVLFLTGYFKHSRGTLSGKKIIPLWVGTFFYNALPLSAIIYQLITMPDNYHNFDFQQLLSPYMLLSVSLIVWWAVAASLSIGAIYSELTENQQY